MKGDPGIVGAVASRLGGSSDIYQERGGSPLNSINFVTCHDGFTLSDLVSFNQKHNEANGEGNHDGINDNLSWNCGAEGDSGDQNIDSLRMRQVRNFMAILLLSRGIPMLVAGDEVFRSRRKATTTLIARITRSVGSTGLLSARTPSCIASAGA